MYTLLPLQKERGSTNNYRVCGVYSPEPSAEVYCARQNFDTIEIGLFHGNPPNWHTL